MPISPAPQTVQVPLQEDLQLGNRIKTISVKRKAEEDEDDYSGELGDTITIQVSQAHPASISDSDCL